MPEVAALIEMPVLLLHGEDDKHVPPGHSERLLETLKEHKPNDKARLVLLPKGNHFLSSASSFNMAVDAIVGFCNEN